MIILLEKVILKDSRFVLPVTDELMDLAEKRKVKNKIISPNYVDLSKFREIQPKNNMIPSKEFNVMYVGRFEEEKGIKPLLNAIKILSEENPAIQNLPYY